VYAVDELGWLGFGRVRFLRVYRLTPSRPPNARLLTSNLSVTQVGGALALVRFSEARGVHVEVSPPPCIRAWRRDFERERRVQLVRGVWAGPLGRGTRPKGGASSCAH
jgi:hypothetical protein